MTYEERIKKAQTIINELFLYQLQKNFPTEMFEKYKNIILKIVNKEMNPILLKIINTNKDKLEKKYQIIEEEKISEEEKQIKFNEELNSLFNIFGKVKMLQKTYVIQKNAINYIKFNEGQFSKKKTKKDKEEKIFEKLKKEYNL